jgi:glycosyltransferase involved in cell wall biosynthesis
MSRRALAVWYSRASIYALPAKYEPFGLTALEAGLSGCALVLGDIPSLREIWGNAALFVDPADPGQLRDAIKYLISDNGLRQEFARRARVRALDFSIAQTAAEYKSLYLRLAGGGEPKSRPEKIRGPETGPEKQKNMASL